MIVSVAIERQYGLCDNNRNSRYYCSTYKEDKKTAYTFSLYNWSAANLISMPSNFFSSYELTLYKCIYSNTVHKLLIGFFLKFSEFKGGVI